jgi:hypothetical protein
LYLAEKTWLNNRSHYDTTIIVEAITPAKKENLLLKHGKKIFASACGGSHNLVDLRCKTFTALRLFLYKRTHLWLCYVDDDMYILYNNLLRVLKRHSKWKSKRTVIGDLCSRDWGEMPWNNTILHTCGAMCATRPALNVLKPYLSSLNAFHSACRDMPDDMCIPHLLYKHGIKMQHDKNFLSELSPINPLSFESILNLAVVSFRHISRIGSDSGNLSTGENLSLNMIRLSLKELL